MLRLRNILIQRLQQLRNRLYPFRLPLQSPQGRTADNGNIIAGIFVLLQQIANFHLDQIQHFGIVDQIDFIKEHNDIGNTHLARQKNVLARLRHRTVISTDHQDRAIHLRGTGNHVLNKVRVSRTIYVRIVAVRRLVFDVRNRNRS